MPWTKHLKPYIPPSNVNTTLVTANSTSEEEPIGSIGRPILEIVNLLLDFPHGVVIACNSVNTLKHAGFDLPNFLRAPFEIGDSGIIIKVETDLGMKRLLLDSGSTICILRKDEFIEQKCHIRKHGFPIFKSKTFSIMGKDTGPRDLCALGIIPELDDIDGILGMDFLEQYPIYIDYPNRMLYIGESNPQ